MRQMKIFYGPNGERKIEAFGFEGKVCQEATKFMEEALGKATDVKEKAEWHMHNGDRAREVFRQTGIKLEEHCG